MGKTTKRAYSEGLTELAEEFRHRWAKETFNLGRLQHPDELMTLILLSMALSDEPGLTVIVLDRRDRYLAHECLAIDKPNDMGEYARTMLKVVLSTEERGKKIVVAHNLTGDKHKPQLEDFFLALHLRETIATVGMQVWEHYLYTPSGVQPMPPYSDLRGENVAVSELDVPTLAPLSSLERMRLKVPVAR